MNMVRSLVCSIGAETIFACEIVFRCMFRSKEAWAKWRFRISDELSHTSVHQLSQDRTQFVEAFFKSIGSEFVHESYGKIMKTHVGFTSSVIRVALMISKRTAMSRIQCHMGQIRWRVTANQSAWSLQIVEISNWNKYRKTRGGQRWWSARSPRSSHRHPQACQVRRWIGTMTFESYSVFSLAVMTSRSQHTILFHSQ